MDDVSKQGGRGGDEDVENGPDVVSILLQGSESHRVVLPNTMVSFARSDLK